MSRAERIWRIAVGIPLALFGLAIILNEAYARARTHTDPSTTMLAVGAVLLFAGGFLINDTLTKRIVDAALTRLPSVRGASPPRSSTAVPRASSDTTRATRDDVG
jgi:hypothetical protein